MSIRRDSCHRATSRTGGEPWIRAATTCSARSRPTPPSNGPTSSSSPRTSSADSSIATRSASRRYGGLTLIDEEPDYLAIAPDLLVPQPQPLPRRPHRRVGERDGGHRDGRRARRAVQPGRHLRRVRRGGPRGGRVQPGADRRATTCSKRPGSHPRRPSASARTRMPPRPTRGPPGSRKTSTIDDDEAAARRLYDLALEYQERSQRTRGAAARGVRGRRCDARRASSATS